MSSDEGDQAGSLRAKLLKKALESSADKVGAKFAGQALGRVLPAILAEPVGAVMGSVAAQLVDALFGATPGLERKVDQLLATPLDAARPLFGDADRRVSWKPGSGRLGKWCAVTKRSD